MYPILNIKTNHDRRIKNGHLWIFSNELKDLPDLESGALVHVKSNNNDYGIGFYNRNSLISVRLLSSDNFSPEMLRSRIEDAYALRMRLFPSEESFRLIYGESDLLPGLIIDKFEHFFAIQILSAGWEMNKQILVDCLLSVFPETKGIIQKNNSKHRELENLSKADQILYSSIPDEIIINENEIKISVSIRDGQKTGYFFDQRENRMAVRRISAGMKVLDCFSNTGGFALSSAKGNAREVTAIDISATSVENIKRNSELNGYFIKTVCDDVFAYLKNCDEKYDLIILDPPAFTKSRKNIQQALNGYFMANSLALKNIVPGGFLASGSCSQHIEEADFLESILNAAKKQKIELKMIHRGMQSPDHPIHCSIPETQYLKFFIFMIINK